LVTQRVERRLAAVLAADVAGYSRLIGADEEGTLARLKAHRRELIDPKIAEHRGRIVKTTGDGVLVEFASPVEAVRCAGEIQKAVREREGSLPSRRRTVKRTRGAGVLPDCVRDPVPGRRPVIAGATRLLLRRKSKRATLISNHTRTWGNVDLVSTTCL
jgi:hypothetical protein